VCATCISAHRVVQVALDRVLVLPQPHSAEFHAVLKLSSSSSVSSSAAGASSASSSASKQLTTRAESLSSDEDDDADNQSDHENMHCFSSFYFAIPGRARRFEIFDATDLTLWTHSVNYSEIFLFDTATNAAACLQQFSKYLQRPQPASSQDITDTVTFRVWYVELNPFQ
jgi:hypothetical protein